jgi:hypothetical protein
MCCQDGPGSRAASDWNHEVILMIQKVHSWLEQASGGAGPVLRWIWASLVGLSLLAIVFMGRQALS